MTTYRVTGIPISPPFSVLAGKRVGDVFEANIDEDIEKLLIGGGALVVEPKAPSKPKAEPKAEPKSEAKEEPKSEPTRGRPQARSASGRSTSDDTASNAKND